MTRINALFACSRNQWRSPTAERLFRDDPRLSVKSRGLSPRSPRQLKSQDLDWADIVFVMETKHCTRIRDHFRDALGETPLHALDIPDDFQFMDPELIELLLDRVNACLCDDDLRNRE